MRSLTRRRVAIAATILGLAALAMLAPGVAMATAVGVGGLWHAAAVVRRNRPLSGHRLCAAVAACGIVPGLLVPAVIGATRTDAGVLGTLAVARSAIGPALVLVVGAALALLVTFLRWWPEGRSDLPFLAFVGLPVTVAKLAYVHVVRMQPISDFADMWALASRIATAGLTPPTDSLGWIYLERLTPYLLPLRLLFGPEPSSYAIPNVLVGVAGSLGVYFVSRRWFGRPAARAAFTLSLIAPETWLAAEIPTHDVPGAALAVLGLVVLSVAYERTRAWRRSALAWGAAWGVVVLLLDLQRTTGAAFLLACGSLAIAAAVFDPPRPPAGRRWRPAVFAALTLLLLPAASYRMGQAGLRVVGLRNPTPVESDQVLSLFTSTTSWSDGLPWRILPESRRYKSLPVDWPDWWATRLATETALHPWARVQAYARHSRILFALGSQHGIYYTGATVGEHRRLSPQAEAGIRLVGDCFAVFFVAALMLGCWRIARSALPPLMPLAPLAYLAVLAGTLILLGQVQPRYVYAIWYLGAIYAGLGCTAAASRRSGPPTAPLEPAPARVEPPV